MATILTANRTTPLTTSAPTEEVKPKAAEPKPAEPAAAKPAAPLAPSAADTFTRGDAQQRTAAPTGSTAPGAAPAAPGAAPAGTPPADPALSGDLRTQLQQTGATLDARRAGAPDAAATPSGTRTLPTTGNLSRSTMADRLSQGGGFLDVDKLPESMKKTLGGAGITDKDLGELAGPDRAIRGREDFQKLFDRVERGDKNGKKDSVALTDAQGRPTAAGHAMRALDQHVADGRVRTAREGGQRFAGNTTLDATMKGDKALKPGERGEHVERVQQALADMGYGNPETMGKGAFDSATAEGVRRFQRDAGLKPDGMVGRDTLGALAATAPKPGEQSTRAADFDRLYKDGRLDIGVAVGFDEENNHKPVESQVRAGLTARGFTPLSQEQIAAMPEADRTRLGLGADRLDPKASYYLRDDGAGGKDDAVVRLISPDQGGASARDSYKRSMAQDELVMYGGHARYGTGPDFDAKSSGAGNFVVDGNGNRRGDHVPDELRAAVGSKTRSDLSEVTARPDYQILSFAGCTTEDYVHRLRSTEAGGRDARSTDVWTTSMVGRFGHIAPSILNQIDGTLDRKTNRQIQEQQNSTFKTMLEAWKIPGKEGDPREGALLFVPSGTLDNGR